MNETNFPRRPARQNAPAPRADKQPLPETPPVPERIATKPTVSQLRAEYDRLAAATRKEPRSSSNFQRLMHEKLAAFTAWKKAAN